MVKARAVGRSTVAGPWTGDWTAPRGSVRERTGQAALEEHGATDNNWRYRIRDLDRAVVRRRRKSAEVGGGGKKRGRNLCRSAVAQRAGAPRVTCTASRGRRPFDPRAARFLQVTRHDQKISGARQQDPASALIGPMRLRYQDLQPLPLLSRGLPAVPLGALPREMKIARHVQVEA